MCSITMALTGLMTGMQMASQHQQTKAAVQTAEAQAEAAEQNAKLQNRQGELIAEQYGQKQRELDNRRRLIQGAQRAEAGAAGIAGGLGTAMDMQLATTDAWLEDTANLLGAQRDAVYNNYIKEVNYRNLAGSYRAQAAAARRAGSMAQWGTLLSGAASLYGMKSARGTSEAAKSTSAGIAATPKYQVASVNDVIHDAHLSTIDNTGFLSLPKKTVQAYGRTWKAPQTFNLGWEPPKSKYDFNIFGGY